MALYFHFLPGQVHIVHNTYHYHCLTQPHLQSGFNHHLPPCTMTPWEEVGEEGESIEERRQETEPRRQETEGEEEGEERGEDSEAREKREAHLVSGPTEVQPSKHLTTSDHDTHDTHAMLLNLRPLETTPLTLDCPQDTPMAPCLSAYENGSDNIVAVVLTPTGASLHLPTTNLHQMTLSVLLVLDSFVFSKSAPVPIFLMSSFFFCI